MPKKGKTHWTHRKNKQGPYHIRRAAEAGQGSTVKDNELQGDPSESTEESNVLKLNITPKASGSESDKSVLGVDSHENLVPSIKVCEGRGDKSTQTDSLTLDKTTSSADLINFKSKKVQTDYKEIRSKFIQTDVITTYSREVQTDSKEYRSISNQTNIKEFLKSSYYVEKGVQTGDQSHLQVPLISVANKLRFCLSDNWIVVVREDRICISIIGGDSNVQVIKSMATAASGEVTYFLHGRALPSTHSLNNVKVDFECGTNQACQQIRSSALDFETYDFCNGAVLEEKYLFLCETGVFAEKCSKEGVFYRTTNCSLLLEKKEKESCKACKNLKNDVVREYNRLQHKSGEVNTSKTNIRYLSRDQLQEALRSANQGKSKYRRQLVAMKKRMSKIIVSKGENLSKSWSEDFKNITKANFQKMTPIQKLFWDQQLKAASLSKASSMRWHPMVIRMALHFQMISTSCYENMRGSGMITLPSKRTLYDYSHAISAQEGCQQEILRDLKNKLDEHCPQDHQKFVSLIFDEMHVRSNLVYNKQSGELLGYVNLNEVEREFQRLESQLTGSPVNRELAKSILVFMVRSISENDRVSLKEAVAVYSSANMNASGLNQRLWEVIYHLENTDIPVLTVVCDGASTNRSMINMQAEVQEDEGFVYKTRNRATHDRSIFFIIDPCHLLKTIRNNFANSYSHRKSRKLWKNNEDIKWSLVSQLYFDHKDEKYTKCLLSRHHVVLNNFSLMKVGYASHVMSKTVALAIEDEAERAMNEGRSYPNYKEAVQFIKLVNRFFDCFNGHNVTSHTRFRNEDLRPYSANDDDRFTFLKEEFLGFFDEWEEDVMSRQGKFTLSQRRRMMLSSQTLTAMKITINSFIEAVKYLLSRGATQICARRFNQDTLEQYFSIQRLKGGCSNNPDLTQALQNRISIHAQRQAAIPNVRGSTSVQSEEMQVDDTRLPKRPQKRKLAAVQPDQD